MSEFTIWCDFGGVIAPGLDTGQEAVAGAVGVPWAAIAAAADEVAAELGRRFFQPLEMGLITQTQWADRIAEKLALTHTSRASLRDIDKYFYHPDRTLDQPLLQELRRLHNRGLRIGMLTNSVLEWEPHRRKMLRTVDFVDQYLRSHEVGLAKPDPAIFELAAGLLGTPASQKILIDDLKPNCAAAADQDWLAIHHTNTAKTIAQLRNITGA